MAPIETNHTSAASNEQAEAVLLAALRTGDDAAYETLLRRHGGRMLAVARRMLRREDDATEAVQEAFVSAFRALPRFKGDSQLSTWLHRIVVNVCLMKLRSRQRRPERSIEDLLPQYQADGHLTSKVPQWRVHEDDAAVRRETRELVRTSIDQLPDGYREILLLRDIDELSTEETADLLGISINAVKTRLHRARQALRTLLDPHFRGGLL